MLSRRSIKKRNLSKWVGLTLSLALLAISGTCRAQQQETTDAELVQEQLPKLADFVDRFEVDNQDLEVGLPKTDDSQFSEDELDRIAKQVALGRKLFFDPILSKDNSVACASCHRPDQAFTINKVTAVGVSKRAGRRNVPSILNRRFGKVQFWDGRADTLEAQALLPIENEEELGHSIDAALASLKEHKEYTQLFSAAFDDGITRDNLATAIANFERTLVSGNSTIDRFQNSISSLNEQQRHGLWLYESKAGCWKCHSNATYSDEKFHNTGVSWGNQPLDLGVFETTENEQDKGKFKTPSLRDVALTGPYMHDGSIETLREVVEFYSQGGTPNPNLDGKLKKLDLTEREIESLVAFLQALTGDHPWQEEKTDQEQDEEEQDEEEQQGEEDRM